MKNIIIILAVFFSSCYTQKAKSQTVIVTSDTLQWLKTNIKQRSSFFIGKSLSTLIDSLYNISYGLKDYSRNYKSDDDPAHTVPGDTVYTNSIRIYFGEVFGGGTIQQMHEANRFVNTHIPFIDIEFFDKIPFSSKLASNNYIGTLWGPIQDLVRPRTVKSIAIGEY